jgi:hypothetical protein
MAHWPQEKVDQLVHMVTDKINVKSIATQFGVTPTVISSKLPVSAGLVYSRQPDGKLKSVKNSPSHQKNQSPKNCGRKKRRNPNPIRSHLAHPIQKLCLCHRITNLQRGRRSQPYPKRRRKKRTSNHQGNPSRCDPWNCWAIATAAGHWATPGHRSSSSAASESNPSNPVPIARSTTEWLFMPTLGQQCHRQRTKGNPGWGGSQPGLVGLP